MQERWTRTIPCNDVGGRQRKFQVLLGAEHQIVLHAPAGEVAVLSVQQAELLKQALTDAQVESGHRQRTWPK